MSCSICQVYWMSQLKMKKGFFYTRKPHHSLAVTRNCISPSNLLFLMDLMSVSVSTHQIVLLDFIDGMG